MDSPPIDEGSFVREPKLVVRDPEASLNVLGDTQYVLLTGEDTEGRFALIENENPPGVGPPPHVHRNEDEAFHVLEGRVAFEVDGDRVVGEAAPAILELADEVDADAVLLGVRKRSPVGKVLFGSVTQAVILSSDRPTITAPVPTDGA